MMATERVMLVDASGNPILTAPIQLDDTDKLAVSVYGKETAAGDTPIPVNAAGVPGVLFVNAGNTASVGITTTGTDNMSSSVYAIPIVNRKFLYSGTGWDRERNNVEFTLLASAARTASINSADQTNFNAKGVMLFTSITAITDTPEIIVSIEAKDSISGSYIAIANQTVMTAVFTRILYVYPGLLETEAIAKVEAQNLALPRTWRVSVANADADSITYSVSGVYIL